MKNKSYENQNDEKLYYENIITKTQITKNVNQEQE